MIRTTIAGIVAAALAGGIAAAADWQPLIDPAALAAEIEAGEAVILDIRSPAAYAQGHVEGAVNVPYNAWRGPESDPGRPIPDGKLTHLLQNAGIEPDTPVVVTYAGKGTLDFGSAARVYWTLKSAGVEEIAILNGGLAAWTAAGETLATAPGANFAADSAYTLSDTWAIDAEGVEAVLAGERRAILVDARPDAFFEGVEKHDAAARAGTLAGAVQLVHEVFFEDAGRMVADREAVRARARSVGWTPGTEIVSFCNTGHWAATNWFALSEIGGIEGVKLYPESLVGWTRRERIATGG